jgi:hypothetical protein
VVCSPSNCTGCCDDNNSCNAGSFSNACGSNGITCQVCSTNQSCVSNRAGFECQLTGAGGGGGGISDGGISDGGAPDAGVCNVVTCPDGCCGATGCIHYAQQSFSKCGLAGAVCMGCSVGNTCQMGVCAPPNCSACLDSAGNCRTDKMTLTDDHYCGSNGSFCAVCDTLNGASCVGGRCVGTSGSCNVMSCDGCCAGTTCIGASDGGTSDAQCGIGAGQCVACATGRCDTGKGICVSSITDAGPSTCDPQSCAMGCCDAQLGCVKEGTMGGFQGLIDCIDPMAGAGAACKQCVASSCMSATICF